MARLKDNRDMDPARHIGRWAMTMNHFLFKIERADKSAYSGTGLHGQQVATSFPIEILRAEDEEWINQHTEEDPC